MKKNNILQIEKLTHTFANKNDNVKVLENISFELEKGTVLSIIGKSGCGKSTLLRIIAGFLVPTSGRIIINEQEHKKPTKNVLYLQQDYNQLLPWLTVKDNITFPLKHSNLKNVDLDKKAEEMLDLVELTNQKDMYPYQLSGGQKQRVALARVIALNPDLILMDEPFAALDIATREALQKSTREIISKKKNTVLFVTHNINEALYMGDKMLVLSKGAYYIIDNPKVNTTKAILKTLL